MTDLLPAGDKVDIELSDGEQVIVRDELFKVNLLTQNRCTIRRTSGQIKAEITSPTEVTLHSGTTIRAESGTTYVTGWRFDYE